MMNRLRPFALLATLLFPLAAHAQYFFPPHIIDPMVTEYVNIDTGRHVLVRDPAEKQAIASGAAGSGWRSTGYLFRVRDPISSAVVDGNACRFYSFVAGSHFTTAFAEECKALRDDPASGWIFEKIDFTTVIPTNGGCPDPALYPVYRLYDNRGHLGHRFTPDPQLRDELLGAGWKSEGIAFCTSAWFRQAAYGYTLTGGKPAESSAECDDDKRLGPCTALRQLPPMSLVSRLPTEPPVDGTSITGLPAYYEFYSGYPASDPVAVAGHSFLQTGGAASIWGIHLNSLDRTGGDYSSIGPVYRLATAAPVAGAKDARVFPWGDGRDNYLELDFHLKVTTLRLLDSGSHAYGHPTLEFIDAKSGRRIEVGIGAYGTVPGTADYVGRDAATGRVLVSTTFREIPAFGKLLSGGWIACSGNGSCDSSALYRFIFRIDRAAFQEVVARARTLEPALSSDGADYLWAAIGFKNEAYRNAEVGVLLFDYFANLYQR